MPHKTWAVGEEVLAADFNAYLQQQVVPQFPNVAARNNWTTAPKGALCVTTDTNAVWLFDGTSWGTFPPPAGASTVPHARVFNANGQTVPITVQTAIRFTEQRVNVGGMHSTTVNNTRFTIASAGWYSIGACIAFPNNTAGDRELTLRVDGTTDIATVSKGPSTQTSWGGTASVVTTEYQLTAGQYVEVTAWQNVASTLAVHDLPDRAPEFWVTRLGT